MRNWKNVEDETMRHNQQPGGGRHCEHDRGRDGRHKKSNGGFQRGQSHQTHRYSYGRLTNPATGTDQSHHASGG